MSDDQQSVTKQGLTPSSSGALSTANQIKTSSSTILTANADNSTNGMKFLTVPGQNPQMTNTSSGKVECFVIVCTLLEF